MIKSTATFFRTTQTQTHAHDRDVCIDIDTFCFLNERCHNANDEDSAQKRIIITTITRDRFQHIRTLLRQITAHIEYG